MITANLHTVTMRRLLDTRIGRALQRRGERIGGARRYHYEYERVLGTSLELQVVTASEAAARRAEAAVLAEIDRLEPILSGWSPTSQLARWQDSYDVSVPVSAELADVLIASDAWRERTARAFDPAAQAIVERLRESTAEAPAVLGPLLDELRGPPWVVDRTGPTARRLSRHAISLDAIAKGYIVTRAAARAREVDGVAEVLLNIGGDLQHFGTRPVGVGIADPSAPAENAPPIAAVRVRDAALATSGGYRRGVIVNGRRVSHIVDPRTGRPAERIASASVIAPDCATADALSTAFSVMDPQESIALADAHPGVGCLLVDRDGAMISNAAWNARAIRPRHETTH
jgi:thiamine biosynthesis lipoprotein